MNKKASHNSSHAQAASSLHGIGFAQFDAWFQGDLGQLVIEAESARLSDCFAHLFGFHVLLLGGGTQRVLMREALITHQVTLSPLLPDESLNPWIQCDWCELPIYNESIDVVLMPHTHELLGDTQALFKEVARVLVPNGHVLICGFNPHSFWGVWKYFLSGRGLIPWEHNFQSALKISESLKALDFSVIKQGKCWFKPPFKDLKRLDRFEFLERMGAKLFPWFGGVYYLQLQKQVKGVTPIKTRFKRSYGEIEVGDSVVKPTHMSCEVSVEEEEG